MQIDLEGTSITENAVLTLLLCQRNLERIESGYLASALCILANDIQIIRGLYALSGDTVLTNFFDRIADDVHERYDFVFPKLVIKYQ